MTGAVGNSSGLVPLHYIGRTDGDQTTMYGQTLTNSLGRCVLLNAIPTVQEVVHSAGAIDEADIAVEGLETAVAALERLTQMLAYNCREEVTFGLRVRPAANHHHHLWATTWCGACRACLLPSAHMAS